MSTLTKKATVYLKPHLHKALRTKSVDGNGRMDRLLASLMVPRAGFPPLLIPPSRRSDYIDLLWSRQRAVGPIGRRDPSRPGRVCRPAQGGEEAGRG